MAVLSGIRKIINDWNMQRKTIDTLMTQKVEDYELIQEQPLPVRIGKKTIFIGNFTLENETKFFDMWARLVSLLSAQILNWDLSVERKKELLEKNDFNLLADGSLMLEFIYRSRWYWKQLVKILGKLVLKQQAYFIDLTGSRVKNEWTNCSYGYFKRHITKETLIQICYLVYFFNFDGVKKNLRFLSEKLNMSRLTETYTYFWLKNCPGLTGKFVQARAPSVDSVWQDTPSGTSLNGENAKPQTGPETVPPEASDA